MDDLAAALASFDSASGQSQKAMYGAALAEAARSVLSIVDPVGAGSRPFTTTTTTTTTTAPLFPTEVTRVDACTLASP